MDTPPISFTGKLTLQDALNMHGYRSLCSLRRPFRWMIGVMSFLIAAVCVTAIVMGRATVSIWMILALCIYFPVGWWHERRLMVRWQYRRHPEHYVEHTATIDELSVSISNTNMNMRLRWNQLAFLLSTPKGLLFMLPPIRAWFWLPQRLFEGNDSKETIVGYATQNNVPVRTMK